MAEITKILKQQEEQLLRLEAKEVRAFLKVYHSSRRELRDRLDSLTARGLGERWTAHHTRIALAEMEDGIRVLRNNLRITLGGQMVERSSLAFRHLTQVIGHFEPQFLGTSAGINVGAMRRLTASGDLLLHKYSTDRYTSSLMERIQAELAKGHAGRMSRTSVVKRIAGLDDSVFAGMEHRAALIDRMENARAYDAAARAGMEEASDLLDEDGDDDPLMKKASEFIDKRSHPFSAALDGKIAPIKGEWVVPASEVQAAARRMKKGTSGILWRLEGSLYKGGSYPAHFNDRGRSVPWRKSWGA